MYYYRQNVRKEVLQWSDMGLVHTHHWKIIFYYFSRWWSPILCRAGFATVPCTYPANLAMLSSLHVSERWNGAHHPTQGPIKISTTPPGAKRFYGYILSWFRRGKPRCGRILKGIQPGRACMRDSWVVRNITSYRKIANCTSPGYPTESSVLYQIGISIFGCVENNSTLNIPSPHI